MSESTEDLVRPELLDPRVVEKAAVKLWQLSAPDYVGHMFPELPPHMQQSYRDSASEVLIASGMIDSLKVHGWFRLVGEAIDALPKHSRDANAQTRAKLAQLLVVLNSACNAADGWGDDAHFENRRYPIDEVGTFWHIVNNNLVKLHETGLENKRVRIVVEVLD